MQHLRACHLFLWGIQCRTRAGNAWSSLMLLPRQEEPEEAEAAQPAAKAKGGRKKTSKRDVSFAALEDEEDLAAAPAGNVLPCTASCHDDLILWHAMEEPFQDCLGHTSLLSSCQFSAEEPADQPHANGDAAPEGDDTNAAQEEPQLHRKPKAGKKKKSKRAIGFDMLDEDEDEAVSSAAGECLPSFALVL